MDAPGIVSDPLLTIPFITPLSFACINCVSSTINIKLILFTCF